MTERKPIARQFIRYLVVGGAALGLDMGIVLALGQAGIAPQHARIVSLILATLFTWVLNRFFSFAAAPIAGAWRLARELALYGLASLAGMTVNYLVFVGALHAGVHVLTAMVAGTLAGICVNFPAYRLIFKRT